MEDSYGLIMSALVALVVWFIKAQSDRRYKEQAEVNKQVSINTNAILENKLRDEASIDAFNVYKKTISSDFEGIDNTLNKILGSLEKLNETVNILKVEIEKLKK